jgi:predicted HD phosphohydrolase
VSDAASGLSADEILDVLAAGADRPLAPGAPVSQLDHARQTAALLGHLHPGDGELAAAGLVHDIGHLLPGGTDEAHAATGARAVRGALGERVAGLVALHVEAKRYLVASEGGYGGGLAGDSVASLVRQGGAMTEDEAGGFLARPWAADALALRRADDRAKVQGLEVPGLAHWAALLRDLSGKADGAVT